MNWRISKVGYRLLLTLYHLKDFNDSNGFNPPASPEGEADGGQAPLTNYLVL